MMVALLILLVGTAAATVAVSATQAEVRAAGRARLSTQGRYASEAAMMTSISYLDLMFRSGDWQSIWDAWAAQNPPEMFHYGEPEIDAAGASHALRFTHLVEQATQGVGEVPPVANPGGGDLVGTLGPLSAYTFPTTDPDGGYVVDLTDCFRAPAAMVPGESSTSVQFYCSMTARARLVPPGTTAPNTFTLAGGDYVQDPHTARYASRATIITPAVLVQ